MTATVHDQFIGVADETVYGTGVAPTDFYEPAGDSVAGTYERIESEAIRGAYLREDRFAPNPKGAAGQWTFEVLDKGFGPWFKRCLGAAVITGDGIATAKHFLCTPGDLEGQSFSGQAARYSTGGDSAGALIPFNYHGGKVTEWELSCEVDAIVKLALTLDFAKEAIGGTGVDALATATYPTGAQLLTFVGGDISVDGDSYSVSSVTLTGNNGLKVDRYGMRGANSTTKREPKAEAMKTLTWELNGEFEDKTQLDRVTAALAAGAVASINLNFDSPQGGLLQVTIPVGRFDEGHPNIDRKVSESDLKGVALAPADGSSPFTVIYAEPDPA